MTTVASVEGPSLLPWPLSPAKIALGLVAVGALVAAGDDEGGMVLCPFRVCTGGYCPGCGLTRSAGRLATGDVVGSWHRHPFLIVAVLQLLLVTALWTASSKMRRWLMASAVPLLIANAAVLLMLWGLRMSLGDVPAPFGL